MVASPLPRVVAACMLFTLTAPGDSPWAVRVVEFEQGSGALSLYDWVNLEESEDPDLNAPLGRPNVDTDEFDDVTVNPVYPAWNWWELVSIGENGYLILEMGRPITNHPENPYGIDFLVFGNSFFVAAGSYPTGTNSPIGLSLANPTSINHKPGVVSVSEDLITWYTFDSPTVGNLMPTLGRVWDEDTNAWGDPTDPTIPPDPALSIGDFSGMALTELIRRYRGGAGGTGFDLEWLNLPPNAPTSFRYVRIHMPPKPDDWPEDTPYRTEIDAVTVVSPASERRRWEIRHFPWLGDPAIEQNAVGVHFNAEGEPSLLHPDAAPLPGWVLEWSPSLSAPDWKDAGEEQPVGPVRFFRAAKPGDPP